MAELIRAGIIPFSLISNTVFVCLGVDAETGKFGDFGGGIEEGESIFDTAARELEEESCGIFTIESGEIESSFLFNTGNEKSITFWIVFDRDECQMKRDELLFTEKRRGDLPPEWKEMSSIRWMSIEDLMEVKKNKYLEKDLEEFFSEAGGMEKFFDLEEEVGENEVNEVVK